MILAGWQPVRGDNAAQSDFLVTIKIFLLVLVQIH